MHFLFILYQLSNIKNIYQTRYCKIILKSNWQYPLCSIHVHTSTHMYRLHIPSDLDAQVSGVSLLHVTGVLAPMDDKSKAALIRQINFEGD